MAIENKFSPRIMDLLKGEDESEQKNQVLSPRIMKMLGQESESPDRTVMGTLGDVGVTMAKAVVGVGESFVGLSDIPSFGLTGKALEYLGWDPKKTHEILSTLYTPAQKAANLRVQKAEGFVETVKESIKNPSTIAHATLESLPLMFGGAGMARFGLSKAPALLKAYPNLAPVVAGAMGEGLVSMGMAAEQTRQETPDGLLTPKQIAVTLASGFGTGAIALAGGRIAQKLGITDVDTLMAGGITNVGTKGIIKRIIGGGLSEGVFEELPQSMQEQIWSNAAMDRPLLQGVGEAGAQGMLAGGLMGFGAGFVPGGAGSGESEVDATLHDQGAKEGYLDPDTGEPIDQEPPKPSLSLEEQLNEWDKSRDADPMGDDDKAKDIIDQVGGALQTEADIEQPDTEQLSAFDALKAKIQGKEGRLVTEPKDRWTTNEAAISTEPYMTLGDADNPLATITRSIGLNGKPMFRGYANVDGELESLGLTSSIEQAMTTIQEELGFIAKQAKPKVEPKESAPEKPKAEGKVREPTEFEQIKSSFKTKQKHPATGEWAEVDVSVLSLSEPYNVRGKVSDGNWAVRYETPSTLGGTGKQTNTEYFTHKKEAVKWIKDIKERAEVKAPTVDKLRAEKERKKIKFDKARKEKAVKAKSLRSFIGYNYGVNINDVSFSGELNDIRWDTNEKGKRVPAKGFPVGFFNKTALSLDVQLTDVIEAGWLPPGSTDSDLLKAIEDNLAIKYGEEGETLETDVDKDVEGLIDKEKAPEPPGFANMIKAAQEWQGAALNADRLYDEADKSARLKHSEMTTKGDLDAYLMKKFSIDAASARSVSNQITFKNLPPLEHAKVLDYEGEPWADTATAYNIEKKAKAKAEVHDYSSTQVNFPEKAATLIKTYGNKIPDKDLYIDPDDPSYGREDEPHITVRYGMETVDVKDIAPAFEGLPPIKVKAGKVSIFEADDYDVVKIDIESPDLLAANKKVGDTVSLPGETFKDYKPHATIAYVKKGEGQKYVGDTNLEGQEFTIDKITFSGKDGNLHEIPLTGKSKVAGKEPKAESEGVTYYEAEELADQGYESLVTRDGYDTDADAAQLLGVMKNRYPGTPIKMVRHSDGSLSAWAKIDLPDQRPGAKAWESLEVGDVFDDEVNNRKLKLVGRQIKAKHEAQVLSDVNNGEIWIDKGKTWAVVVEVKEGHNLAFMKGQRSKEDLDKVYQDQIKHLEERFKNFKPSEGDAAMLAKMLAETKHAYEIELKNFPTEKPVKPKEPAKPKKPKPKPQQTNLLLNVGDTVEFSRPRRDLQPLTGKITEVVGNSYRVRGINGFQYEIFPESGHKIEKVELEIPTGEKPKEPSEVAVPDDWKGNLIKARQYALDLGIATQNGIKEHWTDHAALVNGIEENLAAIKPVKLKEEKSPEKRIAKIVPHPDGEGYAISIGENRWVSGGAGAVGGGDIGKWATVDEAIEKGTKHLKKDKWTIQEPAKKASEMSPDEMMAEWDKQAAEQKKATDEIQTLFDEGVKPTKEPWETKEVWQLTKGEQLEHIGSPVRVHKAAIIAAHKAGETIPKSVIDSFRQLDLPVKPTAKGKAQEAKQHLKNAADKFKQINKILGPEGAVGGFDEGKWSQIRPLLMEALSDVLAAGKSGAEFVALSIKGLSPAGRPYFERFVQEEINVKPPKKRENPRTAAIGVLSGAKATQAEESGWVFGWADEIGELSKENRIELSGPLSLGKVDQLIEAGLSAQFTKPKEVKEQAPRETERPGTPDQLKKIDVHRQVVNEKGMKVFDKKGKPYIEVESALDALNDIDSRLDIYDEMIECL